MQATNYSSGTRDRDRRCTPAESLFCRGLTTQPGALKNVYDFNPGYGGPIVKDKLWFFATARWTAAENYVPNNYPNLNFVAGRDQPDAAEHGRRLTYTPDTSQDLLTTLGGGGHFWEQTVRLSYQMDAEAQARHLLQQQEARELRTPLNTNAHGVASTSGTSSRSPTNLVQWSAPQTNRLLLEAGLLASPGNLGQQARADTTSRTRWPSASPTTTRRRWCPATCS